MLVLFSAYIHAKNFFSYVYEVLEPSFLDTRTIYCTKNFFSYEELKEMTGKIPYTNIHHHKEVFIIKDETCEDLLNQCKENFGNSFQYIQSGTPNSLLWDTVEASGTICPYLYADNHYDHIYDN